MIQLALTYIGCIPFNASINGLLEEDSATGAVDTSIDIEETDIEETDTEETDTEETDTEETDTEDTQPQDSDEWHLNFSDGLFLQHSYTPPEFASGGIGSEDYPLLSLNNNWGFGFQWAPGSTEVEDYMFGSVDASGQEMSLFQVGNIFLTIQFVESVEEDGHLIPNIRLVIMDDGELCTQTNFHGERAYHREDLNSGFRLYAFFEEKPIQDKFVLGLEPNLTSIVDPVINNSGAVLPSGCPSGTQGFFNVEFGKADTIADANQQVNFRGLKGRVDDLIIFHATSETFVDDPSELYINFFSYPDLSGLTAGTTDNDNLFHWDFTYGISDQHQLRDVSEKYNDEPTSGHSFYMKQRTSTGVNDLFSDDVGDYFVNGPINQ